MFARVLFAAHAGRLLFAVLAFGLEAAWPRLGAAQPPAVCPATPTCDPLTQTDRRECGALVRGTTAAGQWTGYWWPVYKTDETWWWCPFVHGLLDKYRAANPQVVVGIAEAISSGPTLVDGVMRAMQGFSIRPPAGTADEYEFRRLFFEACTAMGKATPHPDGWKPGYVYTCGDAPVPPAPLPSGWFVAPTSICATADKGADGKCLRRPTYPWDAATRTRSTTAAAERVDIGAPCDATVGASGFYGVLQRADRVAPCVKR